MSVPVAFFVGAGAAVLLAGAGFEKLSRNPYAAMRRLGFDPKSKLTARLAIWGAAVIEIAVAVLVVVPVFGRTLTTSGVVLVGVVITAVGLWNQYRLGTCGCSSALPDAQSIGQLVTRNSALFGALVVSCLLGPTMDELRAAGDAYAVALLVGLIAYVAVAPAARARWGALRRVRREAV